VIPLYGFKRSSNTVIQLDDQSVVTDEGAPMSFPNFVTSFVDLGPAGGTARLRRVAQTVTLFGNATIRLVPRVNESEDFSQAETFSLSPVNGTQQVVELYPALTGTRFAIQIEVLLATGPLWFGECDIELVPKRSTVRA